MFATYKRFSANKKINAFLSNIIIVLLSCMLKSISSCLLHKIWEKFKILSVYSHAIFESKLLSAMAKACRAHIGKL